MFPPTHVSTNISEASVISGGGEGVRLAIVRVPDRAAGPLKGW
jgi:hypothetical protein